MRFNIKLRWPFIKTRKEPINTSQPKDHTPSVSPSYNLYRSIVDLPLSRWIDLTVNGYEYAIVKDGQPPVHELRKTIRELKTQYADASGDHEYRFYCNIIKEITDAQLTLQQIESLVSTLRTVYTPVLAKALNSLLRASLVFDVYNAVDYDKNLDRALKRSRGIKLTIDLKQIQIKQLEQKYENGNKPTQEYYLGILISLEQDAGFSLHPENITVWQFCERISRFNKKSEQIKARTNGR